MRLLHIIHDLAPAGGGPPEHLRQLAAAYGQVGVEPEVLSLDPPDAAYLARYPFPVHALGSVATTYGYNPAAGAWLRSHARDYDALIIDGLWQYPGVAARAAALAAGVPYLVFPHGMLDPWFRRRFPWKHVKKQLFWWASQYAVLRDANRVVFTTEAEQALAARTFWPHRWRSAVVPLGTNRPGGDSAMQEAAFRAMVPGLEARRFFLFLGRIHVKKGCDLLLRAFAWVARAHPDLDLVLAGPDQDGLRAGLRQFALEQGLGERVHFPGMLEGDVKWGAFRAAEAFVLPSHQENFGIAIAEAIACGVPVLISDKINIWRYVEEDGTGFVDEDTEAGTLRLIERWLGLNLEERRAIAARTAPSFEKRFSMHRCAAGIRALVDAGGERASMPATEDSAAETVTAPKH